MHTDLIMVAGAVVIAACLVVFRKSLEWRDDSRAEETQDDFTLALRRNADRMERMGK